MGHPEGSFWALWAHLWGPFVLQSMSLGVVCQLSGRLAEHVKNELPCRRELNFGRLEGTILGLFGQLSDIVD